MNQQNSHNLKSAHQLSHPGQPPLRYVPPQRQSPSLPVCAICEQELSSLQNVTQLLPCNHALDLSCAIDLLSGPPLQSRQCPVCLQQIISIRYAFHFRADSSITWSTHIPGSSTPDDGPFLREDEIVEEGMPDVEKRRRRELRRLRTLEDYEPPEWKLHTMGYFVKDGDKVLFVGREISLHVRRGLGSSKLLTAAMLSRVLTIKVLDDYPVGVELLNPVSSSDNLRLVREEVSELLEGLGLNDCEAWSDWEKLKLDRPEYKILRDGKGLEVASRKFLVIERKSNDDIEITQFTTLSEMYPIAVPSDSLNLDPENNIVDGTGKRTCLREISLAQQEIQGVFEMFKAIPRHNVEDLDTGCSSIMDPIKQEDLECEYCDVEHRNGNCKIPDLSELTVGSEGLSDM